MADMTRKPEPKGADAPKPESADPVMDQLKAMYDEVADEPLPAQLLDLLEKLDEAERKR